MPKPYSVDLRKRAVAAYDAGRLQSEVAQLFKISLATLKRWLAQRRAGQSLAPKASRPGPRGAFGTPEALAALEAQLKAHPDERLLDHCQRWQARTGQPVSLWALHRACRALDWTHKKKAHRQRTRRRRTGGVAASARRLKAHGLGLCRRKRV
jgi:transposase